MTSKRDQEENAIARSSTDLTPNRSMNSNQERPRSVQVPFLLAEQRRGLNHVSQKLSSPAESHRQALPEPDVNLSIDPAPIGQDFLEIL